MRRRGFACLVLLGSLIVSGAQAEMDAMPVRSFDRFEFDTVTAHGAWVEVATALSRKEENRASADVITVEPRLVYGGDLAEGGLIIPYHQISLGVPSFFGQFSRDENGIGDIRLYGKVVPLRTKWFDGGLGLDLSFPSGDEHKGLGAGVVGFLPYGMAAVHLGSAALRAHFGYRAFAGSNEDFLGRDSAPNSFVYGGGVFAALGTFFGVRAELVGESLDALRSADLLAFEPGVDIRVPLGAVDLLLRPTGAVGLTDDAPDWGIGGSVGLAWNPNRSSQ